MCTSRGREEEERATHLGSLASVGCRLVCDGMSSTRWYLLRFLWSVIWKHDAPPWREVMTDDARK